MMDAGRKQTYSEIILDNGTSAILMPAQNEDLFSCVIWIDAENGISFTLIGECTVEDLINIATYVSLDN